MSEAAKLILADRMQPGGSQQSFEISRAWLCVDQQRGLHVAERRAHLDPRHPVTHRGRTFPGNGDSGFPLCFAGFRRRQSRSG